MSYYGLHMHTGAEGNDILRLLERIPQRLRSEDPPFVYDFVVASAGFDSLVHDPIGSNNFEPEDFRKIGKLIRRLAGNAGIFSVLEGGYDLDNLGHAVAQYMIGLGAPRESMKP